MFKLISSAIVMCLISTFSFGLCYAEGPATTVESSFDQLKLLLKNSHVQENDQNIEIKKFAVELVQGDPELANKIFDLPLVKVSPLGKFIEDTNLKIKAFEADKDGESASLGFSYDYGKNHKLRFGEKTVNYSGLDLSFKSKGNVAFDRDINPNDFLDTKLSWSYFSSKGGVVGEITDKYTLEKLDDLTMKLTKMKFEELTKSTQWQEYKGLLARHMTDQYYFDIGFDGGLESDQSFDDKQYTFGVKTGLVPRGWGKESILGKCNVLDYIPALIRRYSGVDDTWQPRGTAFPSLLLGVDRVNPEEGDPRDKAGDNSDFTRLKLEASFKTLVTQWEADPIYLEANFRFYHEFGAMQQVKAAGLAEFNYFSAALRLPKNLFVSYSTGKLPLDQSNDKVYEVGLSYNF